MSVFVQLSVSVSERGSPSRQLMKYVGSHDAASMSPKIASKGNELSGKFRLPKQRFFDESKSGQHLAGTKR